MRRWVLLLAVVLALPIAGCGGDDAESSEGGGAAGDMPTIRLQGLNSGISPIVLKAIETENLDAKHGFNGEFIYLDPDAASQTFLQGESDVSFDLDAFGTAIAQNGGQEVTGIYPILNNNASIIVKADSPYRTPKDLVGKRVGHFGDDSGTTSVMAALLGRDFGINVLEDYDLVEAGPPALVELLDRGEVDAIFDFTPHTERAITEAGGRVIYLAAEQDQEGAVPGLAYVTSRDEWFRDNPDLARAVQAAAQDAIKLFVDSDYELLREEPYASLIDQSDETMDAIIKRANEIPLMVEDTWNQQYADGINDFVNSMGERKILLEKPPPGPVVRPLDALLGG
jgi:NitT/TauT family transport system substrate-binding protein